MNFFDELRSWFISAANIFLNLALDAYDWPIVGSWLGDGFAALVDFASDCAYALWKASNWYDDTIDLLSDILSWTTIKNLIRGFWPGIDDAIAFFNNLVGEAQAFVADPIKWLRDKFENDILPWAKENIPFIATLYTWYTNFRAELESFFDNPKGYLRDKFENDILPWAIVNIPFFGTLYSWYINYKVELQLFFDDPIKYLRDKFENDILPWAKENIPFITTLAIWVDYYSDTLTSFLEDPVTWLEENTILGDVKVFFSDPLKWLYDRVEDFMDRYW
uniref:Uncharacterized protein n=1 Tax=viral metagenome TaxID=1070528 RepID=A0A6M3M9V8_9ZZZZ